MGPEQERPMWLRDQHFLKLQDGKVILWDYANHKQFEVGLLELGRLIQFSAGASPDGSAIDQSIRDAGVLSEEQTRLPWGWDWLAEIFHLGTNHPLPASAGLENAESYLEFCESISAAKPEIQLIKGGARVALPPPDLTGLERASLWDTLAARRTCRDFRPTPIPLEQVSTLLYAAFGAMERSEPDEPSYFTNFGYRRTSPSAGGLQASEPYLWASCVEGLEPGIYHYLSCEHELEIVQADLPADPIGTFLCNQNWANDLPCGVFVTCCFDKMWWKYPHSRAYRPLLMDVGHLSQTLNLCIVAMGLEAWVTGYFHDRELNELLKARSPGEHVIFFVGFGHGTGSSVSREMREVGEKKMRKLAGT